MRVLRTRRSKTDIPRIRRYWMVLFRPMRIFGWILGLLFVAPGAWAHTIANSPKPPDIVVAADGTGAVKTVQEAINRVPADNPKRFVIRIKPGTYYEQIRIPANKPFITLAGDDTAKTVLTFKLSNHDAGTTSAAYATYIGGHDFLATNITFEN